MNQVQLIGRLTRDPETRKTQNGIDIARYTLAVDRRFKKDGEPDADFIRCVAFNKGAQFAEKWLHKGTKVAVIGRIQTGTYTKNNGETGYTFEVITDNAEFVESRKTETPEDFMDEFVEVPEDVPFR
jgi:single-strand DNA-binding protein